MLRDELRVCGRGAPAGCWKGGVSRGRAREGACCASRGLANLSPVIFQGRGPWQMWVLPSQSYGTRRANPAPFGGSTGRGCLFVPGPSATSQGHAVLGAIDSFPGLRFLLLPRMAWGCASLDGWRAWDGSGETEPQSLCCFLPGRSQGPHSGLPTLFCLFAIQDPSGSSPVGKMKAISIFALELLGREMEKCARGSLPQSPRVPHRGRALSPQSPRVPHRGRTLSHTGCFRSSGPGDRSLKELISLPEQSV